jgi:hypothetical protein
MRGLSWPSLELFNTRARKHTLANFRGADLQFVTPREDQSAAVHYETRIAETGKIATRKNWHDFFNAVQWLTFPKSKAMISEMHARLLGERGEAEVKSRSIPRDVLTLFDEGGVIVISTDQSLLDAMRAFRWKRLFVERRDDVIRDMRFFLYGHSVLEKMLEPFIGITAKALLLKTGDDFLKLTHAAQIHHIDAEAANWLAGAATFSTTRVLQPLPVLGIPGWDKRNESPSFYDNINYFRDGYLRDKSGAAKPA